MKALDKIYIPIIEENGKRLLCTNWWETDTSSRNAYVNETISYIRKDALLKWANERYKSTISNVGCYTGHSVWAEVIEHINEM